ncbi:MAG: VWA domain-containing protein [Oscillospiraceae bacterium]|jgi:magnesium chelatase subunit D|nr:VWA domain-containing protein [Oscillospiraceae bacterium]
MKSEVFPFAAVLGQNKIKNALIWNLVNPKIGGVLISGEKGTAKSTLVRGVAQLSGAMKVVELPLNVTEDRLVGAIDLKAALMHGKRKPEPGILKDADGNILYCDEVNLLSDHIVNALLEAAASGVNILEREGISYRHSSRFILVGSMNPEEGKLRPQLLDRFGLYVEAEAEKAPDTRIEIMRRRLEFERDAVNFRENYAVDTQQLIRKIKSATEFLPGVRVTENALRLAATLTSELYCAGHRGELTLIETAKAIAALDSRRALNSDDIRTAAEYALPHRAQNAAPPMPPAEREDVGEADREEEPEQSESEVEQDETPREQPENSPQSPLNEGGNADIEPETPMPPSERGDVGDADKGEQPERSESGGEQDDVQSSGEVFTIPQWQDFISKRKVERGNGRRNRIISANQQGRYVGYRFPGNGKVSDLAFDATVRAAAPFQSARDRTGCAIAIGGDDLRVKIREKRSGGCILFVVDASASMGANKRMKEVKAAILSLLNVSYQKRDRVGLIAFRKDSAELLLGFTRSVELAQKRLEQLPTGGRTPLASGLSLAYEVIMGLKMRDSDAVPTIVLVSDGRASGQKGINAFGEALKSAERIGNQAINTIVLDTENDFIRFHLCDKLNEKLHGVLVSMEELHSTGIVQAIETLR